jgi:hypothetical protein
MPTSRRRARRSAAEPAAERWPGDHPPVPFFGVNFSVVTAQTDPQLGTRDPLLVITARGGTLTGQITAWAAQWNGQSFNRGTPKPDGTLPTPHDEPVGDLRRRPRARSPSIGRAGSSAARSTDSPVAGICRARSGPRSDERAEWVGGFRRRGRRNPPTLCMRARWVSLRGWPSAHAARWPWPTAGRGVRDPARWDRSRAHLPSCLRRMLEPGLVHADERVHCGVHPGGVAGRE